MTRKDAYIANIQGIAADQALLRDEERRLMARRRHLDGLMQKAVEALSCLTDGDVDAPGTQGMFASFAPRVSESERGTKEAFHAISARRRYMVDVVEACRSILLAVGHPLTVPELLTVHPERSRVPAKALAKALDIRTRYDQPEFVGRSGCYWVADMPLPDGWKHPKGLDWSPDLKAIQAAKEKRARHGKRLVSGVRRGAFETLSDASFDGGETHKRDGSKPVVDPTFNVKGLMTRLNRVRLSKGEPAVPREAWPSTRADAQHLIDEVQASRAA